MTGANPNKHGLTMQTQLAENSGSESTNLEIFNWEPLQIALIHKPYTTAAILLAYGVDVTFKAPVRR